MRFPLPESLDSLFNLNVYNKFVASMCRFDSQNFGRETVSKMLFDENENRLLYIKFCSPAVIDNEILSKWLTDDGSMRQTDDSSVNR